MAGIRDTRTIYVTDPKIIDDYGNKAIIGYENLRKYDFVLCVPAYSESDIAIYGNEITSIMKFQANFDIDVMVNGGNGIFLELPVADDDGLYKNPPFISKPLLSFHSLRQFDGKKQVY